MMPVTNQSMFGFVTDVSIDENVRFYRGNSMRGTFCQGDHLVIVPVPLVDITIGDVIVFRKTNYQSEKDEIVHRVVAILENELITRGDNNLFRDLAPVQPEQIIGKVVMVEDGRRRQEVVGGALGLWKVKPRRMWLKVGYWFRWLFRRPYHLLRLSKIVPRLWRTEIKEVHLKTDHGPLVKYIYKGRAVATWEPSCKRFDCRKPFDLVIPHPIEPQ